MKNNNLNISSLPFEQIIEKEYKIRYFDDKIDSEELKWHFDEKDREVLILESDGWMFQMDNEIPVLLKKNDIVFIKKNLYHRVIKGSGVLKIKIKEFI